VLPENQGFFDGKFALAFGTTYLVNPGTILFVGYNRDAQNSDLLPTATGAAPMSLGGKLFPADVIFHTVGSASLAYCVQWGRQVRAKGEDGSKPFNYPTRGFSRAGAGRPASWLHG
jgi:hypothetical protein